MADVKTFIAVSQAEARQLAEMLTQIENQIANVCGRTVEDGEGNTTVRQGAIQRAEALADVHYRAAMAEAGEEVAEGTVISLPRFAAIKTQAARLMATVELAVGDYTVRTVQVPVIVSTPEETVE